MSDECQEIAKNADASGRSLRAEYVGRINRVIDHIESNLAGDLSLPVLAGVAAFSPFHFHRVFKAVIGENLNEFIRRRRLEKAGSLLVSSRACSITQIAMVASQSDCSTCDWTPSRESKRLRGHVHSLASYGMILRADSSIRCGSRF